MARGGRRDSFPAACFLLLSDHPACRDSLQRQPGEPICNFSTPNQAFALPWRSQCQPGRARREVWGSALLGSPASRLGCMVPNPSLFAPQALGILLFHSYCHSDASPCSIDLYCLLCLVITWYDSDWRGSFIDAPSCKTASEEILRW